MVRENIVSFYFHDEQDADNGNSDGIQALLLYLC
jgi:hypothetical protein